MAATEAHSRGASIAPAGGSKPTVGASPRPLFAVVGRRDACKVSGLVLPTIERSGPVEAWITDDTGFPKKGRHPVGVTRQYCGQLGKQDNCQVTVTLSLANHDAGLPVAYRLYLPEDWAKDQARRQKAKIPETIAFSNQT
jgi:SRSO17 transposase